MPTERNRLDPRKKGKIPSSMYGLFRTKRYQHRIFGIMQYTQNGEQVHRRDLIFYSTQLSIVLEPESIETNLLICRFSLSRFQLHPKLFV